MRAVMTVLTHRSKRFLCRSEVSGIERLTNRPQIAGELRLRAGLGHRTRRRRRIQRRKRGLRGL